MTDITQQDHQKVLIFLGEIYRCRSFREFSTYVREHITNLIPADLSVFATIDFTKRQVLFRGPVPEIPDLSKLINNHFDEHPFVKYQARTLDFKAIKISDFWSEDQLRDSELVYHRFMRHMNAEDNFTVGLPHIFGESAECNPGKGSNITIDSIQLFRGERSFTERDRMILNLIQPHLIQARQSVQAFEYAQQLQDYLNIAGGIAVDRQCQVLMMTQKAEKLLQKYFPGTQNFSESLPEKLNQWLKYQYCFLPDGQEMLKPLSPLNLEKGDKVLNIRLATDLSKEKYLILLSEQRHPTLSVGLLKILGLSQREAEVLLLVMKGKTNSNAAKILHLSISTVKKHLEHIYIKLNVNTRAGATVAAFTQLGALNPNWSLED
jgi:DNA-binding CsgD family transcriptional regulator